MIAAMRSEFIKLSRRRSLIGTGCATVLIATLGTVVPYLTDTSGGGGPLARTSGATGPAAFATASGSVQGVVDVSKLLGVVVLVLAALAVTNEYTYGTLKNSLVRHPDRPGLLGGKITAIALNVAALAVVAVVAGFVVSLIAGAINGVDMSAWTSAAGLGETASALGTVLVSNLTFACLGLTLGVLLRAPAIAIGIGLGWTLIGEQLVSGLTSFADWFPGQLALNLQSGEPDVGIASTLLGLSFWIAGLIAIAMFCFTVRDVDV